MLEKGWMKREASDVKATVQSWPEWVRKAEGLDRTSSQSTPRNSQVSVSVPSVSKDK